MPIIVASGPSTNISCHSKKNHAIRFIQHFRIFNNPSFGEKIGGYTPEVKRSLQLSYHNLHQTYETSIYSTVKMQRKNVVNDHFYHALDFCLSLIAVKAKSANHLHQSVGL